jgi:septum formation protein
MAIINARIYLASQSPRRRELLQQIGVRFDMLMFRDPSRPGDQVNEDPLPDESPDDYVVRVARAKASYGVRVVEQRRMLPKLVLAADTTVDIDGAIVGKPVDAAEAMAILTRLSGRSHRVLTCVAIGMGKRLDHVVSISEVRFRTLELEEMRRYIANGEPLDKAGAYGIQGKAAMFVEEIRGSHSGIMGLPLCETALLLRRFGYPI